LLRLLVACDPLVFGDCVLAFMSFFVRVDDYFVSVDHY
jgi:hypothetical protein